jgi:Mobilization protein NikA
MTGRGQRPARDRINHLQVVVDGRERQLIQARAREAGLSVSAYLRNAGLGQRIRSVFDHEAVLQLAKLNGDQGRLGGLLKLWLVDRPGYGLSEAEVRRLLDRIGELQGRLAEVVGRV